jgi:uncharacterized protein (TIGR03067 family)
MMNNWRSGLVVLALLMTHAEARPQKADDVQGIWKPTQAELGGNPLPEAVLAPLRLELSKGKYSLTGAESPDSGTYAFDPSKNPKTMDVTGTDGPNKGKTFPAIYELDGDTLRICYDLAGKERPKQFKTAKQTKLYLVTYKRDKR